MKQFFIKLFLLQVVAGYFPLYGQKVIMVKDINKSIKEKSSDPQAMIAFQDKLYFMAYTAESGNEFWKSDGTSKGTVLIKDINPGKAGSLFSSFYQMNKVLYFGANDSIHGYEFWKSDGTSDGTILVKDLYEGIKNSFPQGYFVLRNKLYFLTSGISDSIELWKSDGSSTGTQKISPLIIMPDENIPLSFEQGGIEGSNNEVFKNKTDSTVFLFDHKNFFNGSGLRYITHQFLLKDELFFLTADNGILELWKTNGSKKGTIKVKNIYDPKDDVSAIRTIWFAKQGSEIYFFAQTLYNSCQLWKTDGTSAGTTKLKTFLTGVKENFSREHAFINKTLFFIFDTKEGYELWKTDGSSKGTVPVKNIFKGKSGSNPAYFKVVNNILYFSANDGIHGKELWRSDGTLKGTFMVKDILPGPDGSAPEFLTDVNGKLFFNADDGKHGRELWTLIK